MIECFNFDWVSHCKV